MSGDGVKDAWMPIIAELKAIYEETCTASLEKVFKEFDKDGSGTIDKKELKAMMLKMGTNLDDE